MFTEKIKCTEVLQQGLCDAWKRKTLVMGLQHHEMLYIQFFFCK